MLVWLLIKEERIMPKPMIGITGSMEYDDKARKYPTAYAFDYLKRSYYEAIERSGGIPLILPNSKKLKLTSTKRKKLLTA